MNDWLRDEEFGEDGPVECVCGHAGDEHTRLAKGWARIVGRKEAWCTKCPCEDFTPDVVWRDSHGNPVDPTLIPAADPGAPGASTQVIAELLDMPADHVEVIERLRDNLASFYYTDIGVLVVLDETGDEIARLV